MAMLGGGGMLESLAGVIPMMGRGVMDESPEYDMSADASQVGSQVSKKPAKKIAEKTTSRIAKKAGTKGALRLAGRGLATGLRVLGPIAALGMAGFDAFQGWKDQDMHKEAFNLEEGDEASLMQKVSASVANVVDMGGLATGLLSAVGLDVNTADIAKGVNWLGEAVGFGTPEGGEKTKAQKVVGAMLNPATLLGLTKDWLGFGSKPAQVEHQKPAMKEVEKAAEIAYKTPPEPQSISSFTQETGIENKPFDGPLKAGNADSGGDINKPLIGRLDRLIAKLQRGEGNSHLPGGNMINTEFDDTVLTLLAYDRI